MSLSILCSSLPLLPAPGRVVVARSFVVVSVVGRGVTRSGRMPIALCLAAALRSPWDERASRRGQREERSNSRESVDNVKNL